MTDDMDDFFDFDALEHGYDPLTVGASQQYSCDPCSHSDKLMEMDWAPNEPPTICPTDLVLSGACTPAVVEGLPQSPSLSNLAREDLQSTAGFDQYGLVNISAPQLNASASVGDVATEPSNLAAARLPALIVSHTDRAASSASWKSESKQRATHTRISTEARQILEDEFAANPYPCSWEMDIIAHQANLDIKKVRNWYNNTRARKKTEDANIGNGIGQVPTGGTRILKSKLSQDSLENHAKCAIDSIHSTQPPLATYLAQSYDHEAAKISDVRLAVDQHSGEDYQEDTWSSLGNDRRGSIITSVASSEGTAPTTYTASSNGSHSNISSFGRDRRRGRRRMTWKETSKTRQTINGVDNSGQPQKDLPFFCTFCPRAFKTKYEWVRHENSVHALRTTWICCDVKDKSLENCPFCGQTRPDGAHMAGHKYQQCRSQPESQRTFYRRDHFTQHLHHIHYANVKHPSVRVGCQARLMGSEGNHFGCKDLALTWRRFGAPMKRDDPMMHCGFCGKRSKDWTERCEHIAEHLRAGDLDRSAWWAERKENHLENLYSAVPYESFRCRYCQKVFTDVQAMNEHSHCRVWSCRFLRSFDDVAAENSGSSLYPDIPSARAHHCHLCNEEYRTLHVEHAQRQHRYRECNQEFYTSEEAFLQHLHNFHGAPRPLLLQGSSVIEQGFMRNKGASFEPVEFNESWKPCLMDLPTTPIGSFMAEQPIGLRKATARDKKHQSLGTSPRESSDLPDPVQRPPHMLNLSPRFFRLSTLAPFLSSRIFYSHSNNNKASHLPTENHNTILEELGKPYVASLAMSAGLVSTAVSRCVIRPETQLASGMTELTL